MYSSEDSVEDSKPMASAQSVKYGLSLQSEGKTLSKSMKHVVTENEFEKELLVDVIPPSDIGVTFDDIGALEHVKDTLKELVMLPLQRPELFCKGLLAEPCKGILLFGPPGTGKTMLAKAIATEAGVNLIHFSMSNISLKCIGDVHKHIKAVFSLASKIAPSVIFLDQVDRMFGRREHSGAEEAMHKIKNEFDDPFSMRREFILNWDGLLAKEEKRTLVIAATNRPFELDTAVFWRLPERLRVNLPDVLSREKILSVILAKEELAPEIDLKAVAQVTVGYSGSDLKNLCNKAVRCRIREILDNESKETSSALAENRPSPSLCGSADVRPLKREDFKHARQQVRASLSATYMDELVQWDDLYGERASGNQLSSFLSHFF